jgi:DNA-binding CsgD family transcriptional regulator/PAS domain-containing protein
MPAEVSSASNRREGLIDAIYDAAGDETLWDGALKTIADAFGSTSSVLVGHSEHDWNAPRFAHFGRLEREFNLRATNDDCPYLPYLSRLRPGAVVSLDQFMPLEQRRKTSWHRDVMEAQDIDHCLMGVLVKEHGAFGVFFLARGKRAGEFGPAEAAGFASIVPHLRRAAQIRCRLNAYGALASQSQEILDTVGAGIVLIDEAGAARPANRAALDAIANGQSLRLRGTKLSARDQAANHELERLIAETKAGGAGGSLAIPRADGMAPCLVRVMALRGRILDNPLLRGKARQSVAVFITSAANASTELDEALVDFYRLTAGEARVANLLAFGHGVPRTAGLLEISENTVKMHAKRIYEKLGVASQVQLAQLFGRHKAPVRNMDARAEAA